MVCQSAGNLEYFDIFGLLRDYTPGTICLVLLPHLIGRSISALLRLQPRYFYSKLLPSQLGPYLAGLIEGDGYIFVPDNPKKRDSKGRLMYPSIQISFSLKDLPFALLLQKV